MGLRQSIKRILRESLDLDYSEATMNIIKKMVAKMDLPFVESFKVVWSEIHGAYEIKLYYPKNFKQDIPLMIIFRALNFISDKSIVELIVYNISSENNYELMDLLKSIN